MRAQGMARAASAYARAGMATAVAMVAATPAHAAAPAAPPSAQEITWYLYDLAPLVIAEGAHKGTGFMELDKLLSDSKINLGIDTARSYGGPVDEVLKPYRGKPQLFGLSIPDASRNLVQMVIAKRIDAMLGQPFEVPYYLGGRHVDDLKALALYPLAEQAESAINHVACANSEFGQGVIRKLNQAIAQPAFRDALAAHYANWLDDDARKLADALRRSAFAAKSK